MREYVKPSIKITYEDDEFKPELSVKTFHKLVSIDRVPVIIGPLNGSGLEAVRPLAQENQVIIFTPLGGW